MQFEETSEGTVINGVKGQILREFNRPVAGWKTGGWKFREEIKRLKAEIANLKQSFFDLRAVVEKIEAENADLRWQLALLKDRR
jgi:hypothetical protein